MRLHQIVSKMTARSFPDCNLAFSSFEGILARLSIDRIARKCRWLVRKPRKIEAIDLVLVVCSMVFNCELTFLRISMRLGAHKSLTISKQAIWSRVNGPFVDLLIGLVCEVMTRRMDEANRLTTNAIFDYFTCALIQDSTCIHLPASLAQYYPGSTNQAGKNSVSKIDVLLDLKTWTLRRLLLKPFTSNDQSEASKIIDNLTPGTLLIRDLGYYTLPSLSKIIGAKAFFLSRLRYGTGIHHVGSDEPINLERLLRRKGRLDMEVCLGLKGVRARLLAIPLPKEKAAQRCRKAIECRDKRSKHSADYLFRLGWTLLITNVEKSVWTPQQALEAYEYRWQVETMFKSWKSYLGFDEQPAMGKVMTPHKAEAIIFAQLLVVVAVLMPITAIQIVKAQQQGGKAMPSQLKLAMFVAELMQATQKQVQWMFQNIDYYCKYEKRKRRNAAQDLFCGG